MKKSLKNLYIVEQFIKQNGSPDSLFDTRPTKGAGVRKRLTGVGCQIYLGARLSDDASCRERARRSGN